MTGRRAVGLVIAAFLAGCARPQLPAQDVVQPAPPPEVTAAAEPAESPEPVESLAPVETPEPEPTAKPGEPAEKPIDTGGPAVELLSPAENAALDAAETVTVQIGAAGVAGAPRAVLVFVDQSEPRLVEKGSIGFVLDDLAPGPHVLRVVPVEDEGLSLTADELVVRTFTVGEIDDVTACDPHAAILTVGRPYGTVARDEHGEVPLDIRVDNHVIGETAAEVKWAVDGGEPEELFQYPPLEQLTLPSLEPGEHTLEVWIENGDGSEPENAGYTRVDRLFTVE